MPIIITCLHIGTLIHPTKWLKQHVPQGVAEEVPLAVAVALAVVAAAAKHAKMNGRKKPCLICRAT